DSMGYPPYPYDSRASQRALNGI
ncbi:uncharacterized protein METZ01_LOCUS278521, partial [marine metagenome]